MKYASFVSPLILACGLATLCACGIGALGRGDDSGGAPTQNSNNGVQLPHTTATPGNANAQTAPLYALRGRFSPGDTDTYGPQAMSWPHSAVVVRVTHTTQVAVNLTNAQGTGNYSLTAQNESNAGAANITATFDPATQSGAVTGLDPNAVYTVTFLKHIETMYATATFTGFSLDSTGGYLTPPAASARRIEVIGDSISCGYGDLGTVATCDAAASNEESEDAYGPVAAATLGADVHVVAWSGKGVYENNGGSTTETMPELWKRADAGDANTTWDTRTWVPQVVVINLGTNDFTNTAVDETTFVQTYTTFLAGLRTAYPKAAIIVSIGPMLQGTELTNCVSYLQAAITARQGAGDAAVYLLQYAVEDTNTGAGCAYHPNVSTQASMAGALVSKINSVVQW